MTDRPEALRPIFSKGLPKCDREQIYLRPREKAKSLLNMWNQALTLIF
ncbi:conserved hypothetical protein [Vibrio cholerae O1 str. 2010EL-1786]|uniref:Uncharacterized protein n=1 Tax=Vibrio cholerae (strain MO10) TaxID=345072 RepID=A0A0X1L0F3_VIBCO|nr:conserved hypothetical protein [Vibrio cholerae O1 str. 2010EL-1786]APF51191.1 hypothetical protein ASZ80_03699 [Vibrio cholerae]EAZ75868.1 hypothetical protein A5E_A0823 [Vibrio cholerae B33]EET24086.1 conserved hypothetical protein [Vibrio cholerae MO10]APF58766.1 hypothetical protein ASZ81_03680 [Vibrio cholerae]